MDDKTIAFYDRNASEIAKCYEQVESSIVATALHDVTMYWQQVTPVVGK